MRRTTDLLGNRMENVTMSDNMSKTVQERVRKSELNAKSSFDYRYLMHENQAFLESNIRIDGEEVEISYDVGDRKPMTDIREEDITDRLLTLQSVGRLVEVAHMFRFHLNPENLFFDEHGIAVVKTKDIYGESQTFDEKDFLEQYKALVGFSMQRKYSFDDYYRGGGNLMEQDKFLKTIRGAGSVSDVQTLLSGEAAAIKADRKANFELLPKKRFSIMRVIAAAFGAGFVISVAFMIFHMFYVETYKDAVIALGENFVRQNYSGCITAMSKIPIERMTTTEQYMLALSYVRGEDISKEQKENVLATLSENDTPIRLAYWIHLGRWETEEALDNAMQLSDGQLQIYAYLKEKMHVEGDTSLTGSEKQERIDEIEKQIEVLERQYNIKVDEEE